MQVEALQTDLQSLFHPKKEQHPSFSFEVSNVNLDENTPSFSGCYKNLLYIPKWDRIIIGHYGSNKISLWNSTTFQIIEFRYTREQIHLCLAFSNKLNRVFTSGLGGKVTSTRVEKDGIGYCGLDILSAKVEDSIRKIICIDNHDLIACAGDEAKIHLFDSTTLQDKGELILNEGKVLSDFVYIEKNDVLAVVAGDRANYIYLFCLKNLKCVGKISTGFREMAINGLEYCSSRDMLIAQPKTGTIKLWNLNCDQVLKGTKNINLPESFSSILSLEELDCFVIGSKSRRIYFYKLSTGQLMKTIDVSFEVEGILFMPKEKTILASDKNLSQLVMIKYRP